MAKVTRVDRRADAGFARIVLTPAAGMDPVRHLLVLEPTGLQMPARPEPPPAEKVPGKADKAAARASAAATGASVALPAAKPSVAAPAASAGGAAR